MQSKCPPCSPISPVQTTGGPPTHPWIGYRLTEVANLHIISPFLHHGLGCHRGRSQPKHLRQSLESAGCQDFTELGEVSPVGDFSGNQLNQPSLKGETCFLPRRQSSPTSCLGRGGGSWASDSLWGILRMHLSWGGPQHIPG